MECPRCHSPRVVKFIDTFGRKRIFCRDCWFTIPVEVSTIINRQRRLLDFTKYSKLGDYYERTVQHSHFSTNR